jgi:CTP:molybdopterin cytidylyltransferase MocA
MNRSAVILAAGAGLRLGGVAKALLRRGSATFLEHILATARSVGIGDAIVVVGAPHADAVAAHARELGARVVVNPDPGRGMASSVAIGFAELASAAAPERGATIDAAWLWPVDHPDVTADTLRALATALQLHEVAQPRLDGRGGHPPLVARAIWARLASCGAAPDGARGVIRTADTIAVEVDDLGVVRDIDTPADLEAAG